jgi:hypothetical protein
MRTAIALAVLVLSIFPASTHAALPGYYTMGLFASADHTCYCWCPFGENAWARIEMWVWCLPSTKGLLAAEFKVQYVPGVQRVDDAVYNPDISVQLGLIGTGVGVAFGACQMNWAWICHEELWVRSSAQSEMAIVPHPESGLIRVASCEMGYPEYSVSVLHRLYVNREAAPMLCCLQPLEVVVGTESTTWGAIKELFTE